VFAAQGKGHGHDGVEMRARDRAECCDDHIEDAACGDGVCQQCDRCISTGEVFAHDARAHNTDEQKSGAKRL